MESIQVKYHVVKEEQKIKFKNISVNEKKYAFPLEDQDEEKHQELFSIAIIKNCCKGMTKPGQYRNINVTLPKNIVPLYFDEEKNLKFNNGYLDEEIEEENNSNSISPSTSNKREEQLLKLISTLTTQLGRNNQVNLGDIKNLFILDNFQGHENAEKWIFLFEQECERHQVDRDERKIQILRLFMEGSAKEWYNSMLYRLSIKETWAAWRNSFLKTYPDKSWDKVCYAFKFHYINGSILEYALKKERLLLEVDSEMRMIEIINHIVVGLPSNIRNNLDKKEISTTEILISKIQKFSKTNDPTDNRTELPRNIYSKDLKKSEKRPCGICEKLGKPGRFHPMELCRNKNKLNEREIKSVNNIENNFEEESQKNL